MTCAPLRHALFAAMPLALSLAALASTASAQTDDVTTRRRFFASVGTGLEFVRGDYGDVDADGDELFTNSFSAPIFARIEWEPITFRIRVPFLLIDGSDQIFGGNDGTEPGSTGAGARRTDYGLGDVTTSLTYTYYPPRRLVAVPTIDAGVRVKIPTAMNGLGTETTDVTPQLELSKTIGRLGAFGGVGYRFRNDDQFDDTWLGFVGLSLRIVDSLSFGVGYDYRQASTGFTDDGHELSAYFTIRAGPHWRITPEAIYGLSDGSPDYGGAIMLSYQF